MDKGSPSFSLRARFGRRPSLEKADGFLFADFLAGLFITEEKFSENGIARLSGNSPHIAKSYPINRSNDPRKVFYHIEDNLLRFYYAFVYPHRSPLASYDPKQAYEVFVKPGLTQYLSPRFQDIVS